ncbi:MAG: type II secretion system F family protein [Acetobacteraceae bacterium]|nr:type II secretion system F family protein [Acetobacteraceae bacterium]
MSVTPLLAAGAAGMLSLVAVVDRLYANDRRAKRMRARTVEIATYGRTVSRPSPIVARRRREPASPWSRRWAERLLRVQTAQPDLYPAPWWVLLSAALVTSLLASAFAARVLGFLGWLSFPLITLLLARGVFGFYQRRRQIRLYEQLPDALSMIVRAVRAGLPVTEALRSVGQDAPVPTAGQFTRLANDLAIGITLQDSLLGMATRTGLQEYRFFAVALALQGQTGGNLTETLENLAEVVRKRVALRARGFALAAEARMTASVLIALPFITSGALAFVAPAYLMVLVTTPRGQTMLLVAVGLLANGIATMRNMIRRSLS